VTVRLNPYIGFQDQAQEAMEFYRSVFGGELTMDTYGASGMSDDPDQKDKIMHAQLDVGPSLLLMASDAPPGMPLDTGSQISISLSGDDEATLRRYWDGLSEGGTVTMPLEPAPWGDVFGMCTDRFGITWMVDMPGASSGSS
jgi:PhnB protein